MTTSADPSGASPLDFAGRTVAISGAAIGFGRAIAERFAAAGAAVFGCDIVGRQDGDPRVALDDIDLTDRRAAAAWIAGANGSTRSRASSPRPQRPWRAASSPRVAAWPATSAGPIRRP